MNEKIKEQAKSILILIAVFLACFYLPTGKERFNNAIIESLELVKWYAREHVIFCLVPAFFIAGAIGVFVNQAAVMKYLGVGANKILAYAVASVSGSILAVCSCTVLPLFAGIYKMGAGLGPATTFLYSGPAINILAIILTARVLGLEIGIARAVGAVVFSVVIGLVMHFIYRKEQHERAASQIALPQTTTDRSLWQNGLYFGCMIGILVFANWAKPATGNDQGIWATIFSAKWAVTAAFAGALAIILVRWFKIAAWKILIVAAATAMTAITVSSSTVPFVVAIAGLSIIMSTDRGAGGEWFDSSLGFAKQILPLLLGGVFIAGILLGRPGGQGVIPPEWIETAVGGNSIRANLCAALAGALMYFATLTEVPIIEGLIAAGMGKGPALALLLAGPALSLPNMLVIRSVMGTRKTMVFVTLVVIMATVSGILFGLLR